MQQNQSTQTKNPFGFEVVLNGGKNELDSATIPIRWFITNPELLRKMPKWILLIEQTESELGSAYASSNGRRKFLRFEDGITYLQIARPGYHKFSFLLFSEDLEPEGRQEILNVESDEYKMGIIPTYISKKFEVGENIYFVEETLAMAINEVNIPAELFAQKPKTGFQEGLWNWVNRWHTSPRDECAYRERMIFAFTIQPTLIFIGRSISFIVALLGTIFVPIARMILYFAGWQVTPLFTGTTSLWREIFWYGNWSSGVEIPLFKLSVHDWDDFWSSRRFIATNKGGWIFRELPTKMRKVTLFGLSLLGLFSYGAVLTWHHSLWEFSLWTFFAGFVFGKFFWRFVFWKLPTTKSEKDDWETEIFIRTVISAGVILFVAMSAYFYNSTVTYVSIHPAEVLTRLSLFVLVCLLVILGIKKMKFIKEKVGEVVQVKEQTAANKILDREKQKMLRYERNFLVTSVPVSVNLKNLPKSDSVVRNAAQTFKVSFWTLKAKVCKPFAS